MVFKNRISNSRNTFSVRFWDTKCRIAFSEKCCNFLIFNPIPHQSISNERSFSVESKFRLPDNKIVSPSSPISADNISNGWGGGWVMPGHPPKYSLTCLVFMDIHKISIFSVKKSYRLFCARGGLMLPLLLKFVAVTKCQKLQLP